MNKIFAINDNGELLIDIFKTSLEASEFINSFDEDDRYLMSISEMSEKKFYALHTIQHCIDTKTERQQLLNVINNSDNQDFIYDQLGRVDSDNWVSTRYMQHVIFTLLEGGYAVGEEDFECVEMLSYDDFCDQLRKEIDFSQNYDAAFKKYNTKMSKK